MRLESAISPIIACRPVLFYISAGRRAETFRGESMKIETGATVLGIIVCPVFNDELVHNLKGDGEVDDVLVLTNDHSRELCDKMSRAGLPFRSMPESEFDPGVACRREEGMTVVVRSNNLGLHGNPAALKAKIEEEITGMQPFVDVLGVYYCQCGNAGWDVSEWCRNMGLKPAAVYRGDDGAVCHDCACVAFGSCRRYMEARARYGDTFYLTPAITYHLEDFVRSGALSFTLDDIPEGVRKQHGIRNEMDVVRWMLATGGIRTSLKVDVGLVDAESFDADFERLSGGLGLVPIRPDEGCITLEAVDSIYSECKRLLKETGGKRGHGPVEVGASFRKARRQGSPSLPL